jgi:[ribosomal protein S18]-alanine N-acetyltransferase
VKLRPATPADIHAIIAIERKTPSAAHWTEAQYASVFSDGAQRVCLVIAEGSGVQGFLVARTAGPEWELENVVVAEVGRRRGSASALMAGLIDEARSKCAEAIFLEVRESNAAARGLYTKYGFAETGRRKSYYSHPREDAILYSLGLG